MIKNRIIVYEHQILRIGEPSTEGKFTKRHLEELQKFYGKGKKPYFSLIHNGIKFCEYVGVLQVGNIQIEILPKTDIVKEENKDDDKWRNLLIDMLKAVGEFNISAPSGSRLKLKANSLLDLYFDIFIGQVEYLIRSGLIKQYRRTEANHNALKGALVFPKHLNKNFIHQERFFTRYITYDKEHIWHVIIWQAILLIRNITRNADLHNRIASLQLDFPEMPEKHISEHTFNNLKYSRKTEAYRPAIDIAKLIILNYHPDLASGKNNVLAIMFNMNDLWEKFVFVSLRKGISRNNLSMRIRSQRTEKFWWSEQYISIRPDIEITKDDGSIFILDTKWKMLKKNKPSSDDLQQMFAYTRIFNSSKTALVFPGEEERNLVGWFMEEPHRECSLISIKEKEKKETIYDWQRKIYEQVLEWML